jgi:hypothetical protein
MKLSLRPLIVGMMIALGLAAAVTATAGAESPLVLVLEGEKISEFKESGTTTTFTLETVGKKTLSCTAGSGTSSIKALEGKPADGTLGFTTFTLTGCKKEKVACRSENSAGEKDAVETALSVWDWHIADEISISGELEPVRIYQILPISGTGNWVLNCGAVKEEIKGDVMCLYSPGLVEIPVGGSYEVLCKAKEGKQETGKCSAETALCEKLAANPLLANLGAGFEGAAVILHLLFTALVMHFIDD